MTHDMKKKHWEKKNVEWQTFFLEITLSSKGWRKWQKQKIKIKEHELMNVFFLLVHSHTHSPGNHSPGEEMRVQAYPGKRAHIYWNIREEERERMKEKKIERNERYKYLIFSLSLSLSITKNNNSTGTWWFPPSK